MEKGHITLVGAGPGDPGLLTLAGKAALERADVVLFDRLIGEAVIAMIPEKAKAVDVGKMKGRHPISQDEINDLMVRYALEGNRVVRLKGGDPYMFGRIAEELDNIRKHDIPHAVVPGVTSAIAAAAYAGIPVTHREYASSIHILTGHAKKGAPLNIPYEHLAGVGGTIVFLMGLSALDEICGNLALAGLAPDTPAALVENGTRSDQRRLVATVADLPEKARLEAFASPALLVIGDVCALAERYDWTVHLPLWGREVLVASSRETASRLADILRGHGCGVDVFAGIRIEPLPRPEAFPDLLRSADWVAATSRNGVERLYAWMDEMRVDIRSLAGKRFAAVGSRTARAFSARGLFADCVPDQFNGRNLAESLLGAIAPGERLLLLRAEDGNPDLADALAAHGVPFDVVAPYRTRPNAPTPGIERKIRDGRYDAVAFTSASAVASFAAAFGDVSGLPAMCIGETTAAAARERGMTVAVSEVATIDAMADAILKTMGKQ